MLRPTVPAQPSFQEEYLGRRSTWAGGIPGQEEYLHRRSTWAGGVPAQEEYVPVALAVSAATEELERCPESISTENLLTIS